MAIHVIWSHSPCRAGADAVPQQHSVIRTPADTSYRSRTIRGGAGQRMIK